ncbi:MAG: hypothetical protein K6L76_14250 [Agarilytica sp.]
MYRKRHVHNIMIFLGNLSISGTLAITSSSMANSPETRSHYAKAVISEYKDTRKSCAKSEGAVRRACFSRLSKMTEAYREARLILRESDYKIDVLVKHYPPQ